LRHAALDPRLGRRSRPRAAAAQVAADAAKTAETGSFISGAIKGVPAVAQIAGTIAAL
jgi:hypothetical protein